MGKDNIVVSVEDDCSGNSEELKQAAADIGKPPRHLPVWRHTASAKLLAVDDLELVRAIGVKSPSKSRTEYLPVIRLGSCSERGLKDYMEDEHVCIDNLGEHLEAAADRLEPFMGFVDILHAFLVFDGHGGSDAAALNNVLKFIVEDSNFLKSINKAIRSAYIRADQAFADETSLDISSGTTALTALINGRTMCIAKAGDCRAVLGKRAVELSEDHKPNCITELQRIEKLGGVVYDGYLSGPLVTGIWKEKGSSCHLSAEPELQEMLLTDEDEFLIMGCDGLWDVMSSQCAVTMAFKELMIHNDPENAPEN